jgi:molybdopterin molybdotransferase
LQVLAQLQKMGLSATYLGLADDNYYELLTLVSNSIKDFDVLIFTGGASVGDFDFIPHIFKELKFETLWDRTGLKPGNPMTVAKKGNKYCIGLSGNPVSSLVQFELIARQLLFKLQGANYKPVRIKARMATGFKRKKADRVAIIPVNINSNGEVETINFHGSAHLNSLVYATALMEISVGVTNITKGEFVYVRPL